MENKKRPRQNCPIPSALSYLPRHQSWQQAILPSLVISSHLVALNPKLQLHCYPNPSFTTVLPIPLYIKPNKKTFLDKRINYISGTKTKLDINTSPAFKHIHQCSYILWMICNIRISQGHLLSYCHSITYIKKFKSHQNGVSSIRMKSLTPPSPKDPLWHLYISVTPLLCLLHTLSLKGLLTQTPAWLKKRKWGLKSLQDLITIIIWVTWPFHHRILPGRKEKQT